MFVTNVSRFLSCATMLHRNVFETQGANFVHSDLIQCYALLAENMGWESIYNGLAKVADGTLETQNVINAARRHLREVERLRQYDHLPN